MGRDHGDPVTWPGADHRPHQPVPSIVTVSDPVTGAGDSVITDLSAASDWSIPGTLASDWSTRGAPDSTCRACSRKVSSIVPMSEAVYEDMEAANLALKVVSLMVVLFYCLLTHTKSEVKQ